MFSNPRTVGFFIFVMLILIAAAMFSVGSPSQSRMDLSNEVASDLLAEEYSGQASDLLFNPGPQVVLQQIADVNANGYKGGNVEFGAFSQYFCNPSHFGYRFRGVSVYTKGSCPQPGDTKTLWEQMQQLWKKAKEEGHETLAEEISNQSVHIRYTP